MTFKSGFDWSAERIETTKTMWADGSSATQIAVRIGHPSRSAVLGKIHRLGLMGGGSQPRSNVPRAPKREKTHANPLGAVRLKRLAKKISRPDEPEKVAPSLPPENPIDQAIPLEQRKTFLELTKTTCRWPVGDVQSSNFFFCGAAVCDDKVPYCGPHCRVAFQPLANVRRRDPDYGMQRRRVE